jgi:hypothetical protein
MPATDEELTKWVTYLEIVQGHNMEEIDHYENLTSEQWKPHYTERLRYIVGQHQALGETQRVLYSLLRGDGLPSSVAWDEM